jgi:hypothetical protein
MDALEAARDHRLDAEQLRSLAAQSRLDPVPYSSPPKTIVGSLGDVPHRRVVDEHLLAEG